MCRRETRGAERFSRGGTVPGLGAVVGCHEGLGVDASKEQAEPKAAGEPQCECDEAPHLLLPQRRHERWARNEPATRFHALSLLR